MSWLFFAVLSYLMTSFTVVVDKIVLKKVCISSPVVYIFYMGLLSIFGLILLPFGTLSWDPLIILLSLGIGMIFLLAIFFNYSALCNGEASRVAPLIGGGVPIFTSFLAFTFIGEKLEMVQYVAFIFLVLGGILISWERGKEGALSLKGKSRNILVYSLMSAFLMSAFFVGMKYIFEEQSFVSGFVWTRIGCFLTTFLFLIPKKNREEIFKGSKTIDIKGGSIIVVNKAIAGVSFAILNFAISLGSVTLVNAMQGVQYVFLFLIIIILSKTFPDLLHEKLNKNIVIQKIAAIMIIGVGLGILGK